MIETDVVEGLVDFLTKVSELRVATLEVQLRTRNVIHKGYLGLCSAHVRCIVAFSSILSSSIESATKNEFRSREDFEIYAECHEESEPYIDISDLRELTNTLTTDFQTLFKAYYRELSNLNMLEFPRMILFNLNEIKQCLTKIQ